MWVKNAVGAPTLGLLHLSYPTLVMRVGASRSCQQQTNAVQQRVLILFDRLVPRASIVGGVVRPRIALLQGRANRDRPHWGTGISLRTQWQDERTRQPHLIFGKRTEVCVLYLVNTVLSEVAVVDCKR